MRVSLCQSYQRNWFNIRNLIQPADLKDVYNSLIRLQWFEKYLNSFRLGNDCVALDIVAVFAAGSDAIEKPETEMVYRRHDGAT